MTRKYSVEGRMKADTEYEYQYERYIDVLTSGLDRGEGVPH